MFVQLGHDCAIRLLEDEPNPASQGTAQGGFREGDDRGMQDGHQRMPVRQVVGFEQRRDVRAELAIDVGRPVHAMGPRPGRGTT